MKWPKIFQRKKPAITVEQLQGSMSQIAFLIALGEHMKALSIAIESTSSPLVTVMAVGMLYKHGEGKKELE